MKRNCFTSTRSRAASYVALLGFLGCGGVSADPATPARNEVVGPATEEDVDRPTPKPALPPPSNDTAATASATSELRLREGAYDPRFKRGPIAPDPIVLATPPLKKWRSESAIALKIPQYRLVQRSVKRNAITDEARWFESNALEVPERLARAMEVPPDLATFGGDPLERVIGREIWIYRAGRDAPTLLVGRPETRGLAAAFALDLRHYEWPYPEATAKGEPYPQDSLIRMETRWAELRGMILYVSHHHMTYADTSHGRNGYISAIDTRDGELLWRSKPLVSNAHTFVIVDDVIISGYGFTAETDYLFLIDRHTGKVLEKKKLRTGPEYILLKGDRIHVRAYDHDYVFELRVRGA